MKINALTNKPKTLLIAINHAIHKGELKTWGIVYNTKDEVLYTHTPEQWNELVLFKPIIKEKSLIFNLKW